MALRNKKLVFVVAAVALLLLVFVPIPTLTLKGKGAVRGVMAPAERSTSSLFKRFSEASAAIRGIGGALEKNRELSHELVRLQAEVSRLSDAENDNKNDSCKNICTHNFLFIFLSIITSF